MANDLVNGDDLASMSRGISPLDDAGYDPDELRANPQMRAQVMAQLRSPYGAQPAAGAPANSRQQTATVAAPPAPRPAPQTTGVTPAQVTPGGEQSNPATNGTAGAGLDPLVLDALHHGMTANEEDEKASLPLANSEGPETATLEKQRTADAAPTQAYGPDGKLLPQFKPTVGQRIERGVEAFGRGGILGVFDPALAGSTPYGAPNTNYAQAETARTNRLASEDQQLQQSADRFKAMTDARKAGLNGLDRAVTGYGDVAKDATAEQNAKTNQAKNQTHLHEHGLTVDDQGNITALPYEQMTPEQQASYDLHQAQTDLANARADVEKQKGDPNSPAYQLAQQRLQVAQQNAQTAIQRLGLSEQEFGFNQDKFYNPQPTAQERRTGDLAQSAVNQIHTMRQIIQEHPEVFGPAAGRTTTAEAWIGSQSPDAQRFLTARRYLADHSAGVFGSRSVEITKSLEDLTDPKINTAAALAGLDVAEQTAQHFVGAGQVHGRPAQSPSNGSAGGNGNATPNGNAGGAGFDPSKYRRINQ